MIQEPQEEDEVVFLSFSDDEDDEFDAEAYLSALRAISPTPLYPPDELIC